MFSFVRIVFGLLCVVLCSNAYVAPPQAAVHSSLSGMEKKFASFVVYKSKAAMSVKIIKPTWESNGKISTVSREGGLFIELAPSTGPRNYDWSKKLTFLMGATECGTLLASFNDGVEFIHDPNAQTPQAGQICKKLKWAPAPDKKSLFVSLSVTNKQQQTPNPSASISSGAFSVPVSWGEFVVIETLARANIPNFLGFADHNADNIFEAPIPPPLAFDAPEV